MLVCAITLSSCDMPPIPITEVTVIDARYTPHGIIVRYKQNSTDTTLADGYDTETRDGKVFLRLGWNDHSSVGPKGKPAFSWWPKQAKFVEIPDYEHSACFEITVEGEIGTEVILTDNQHSMKIYPEGK